MFETEIKLNTLIDTERFGERLGRMALPGDVICLDGELGTGKTTLTQAIAKGVDVPPSCYVTSPSFAILHEYPGRIPIYHIDLYRINNFIEVEELGLEEYFYLSGLTIIEWSEKAVEMLPAERLTLHIRIEKGNERIIRCTYMAGKWREKQIE